MKKMFDLYGPYVCSLRSYVIAIISFLIIVGLESCSTHCERMHKYYNNRRYIEVGAKKSLDKKLKTSKCQITFN
jgi:hypothetical protein